MLCTFYILLKQGVLFALDAYVICHRFGLALLVCVAIHCILMCDCLYCPCVFLIMRGNFQISILKPCT